MTTMKPTKYDKYKGTKIIFGLLLVVLVAFLSKSLEDLAHKELMATSTIILLVAICWYIRFSYSWSIDKMDSHQKIEIVHNVLQVYWVTIVVDGNVTFDKRIWKLPNRKISLTDEDAIREGIPRVVILWNKTKPELIV